MFINLSNHPSDKWSTLQTEAALLYGQIIDIPFPEIDPMLDEAGIDVLVDEYYGKISKYDHPVVMLQGEFVFTYRLVSRLKADGLKVMAGCSKREAVETVDEHGTVKRTSTFVFCRFREY